jgi:hypothetical protein
MLLLCYMLHFVTVLQLQLRYSYNVTLLLVIKYGFFSGIG